MAARRSDTRIGENSNPIIQSYVVFVSSLRIKTNPNFRFKCSSGGGRAFSEFYPTADVSSSRHASGLLCAAVRMTTLDLFTGASHKVVYDAVATELGLGKMTPIPAAAQAATAADGGSTAAYRLYRAPVKGIHWLNVP